MTFPFYKPEETNIDGTPKLSAWDATKPSYEIPITPPKPTADELIQKFYSSAPPTPVFDEAKADRLRRMGRINQLGQGVKVLGDIFSTAIGGTVRRRQPDTTAPALYQSYQGMLDRYEAQKDAYKQQSYQKELQNTQFGIQRADRDTAIKMAEKKQADWMKAKEADNNLSWDKWNANYIDSGKKIKETERHNKAMEEAARTRAEKTGTNNSKVIKPYMQVGKQNISEGEARKLYDEALLYYNGGKKDGLENTQNPYLKGILAAYANQPAEAKKEIVAHYLLDEQRILNQNSIDRGMNQPSIPTPQNKVPDNTTKKDWSVYKEKTAK